MEFLAAKIPVPSQNVHEAFEFFSICASCFALVKENKEL